jgi:ABC-2 type transport system permease protein
MRSFSTLFKTELKITIRHIDSILFGVMFPVGIVLLLGAIYGSKAAYEGAPYSMMQLSFGAFTAVGIVATGLMGLPLVLADYRHKKILKQFKVTPISPGKLLLVQVLVSFLIAVISAIATALTAVIFFNYTMIGSIIKFVPAFLLVTSATYSMGMLLASIAPNIKTANLLCTMIYFPMLFLSGATVPYKVMPTGLQRFADVLPLTQGIKLLKAVSLGESLNNIGFQIILMLSISVICILLSLRFFKWE